MVDSKPDIAIHSILVPLDTSVDRDRTAIFALALETARLHGARLHFLAVVPEMYLATTHDPEGLIEQAKAHSAKLLQEALAHYLPADVQAQSHVVYGSVSSKIIDVAREVDADLIFIHAGRPATVAYALGSVASRVANHAPCSVYVVRK